MKPMKSFYAPIPTVRKASRITMNRFSYCPKSPAAQASCFARQCFTSLATICLAMILQMSQASAQDADAPSIQQLGPHNTTVVRAVGEQGRYIGFDVLADEKLVAPIRFTSRGQIFCSQVKATNTGDSSILSFDGLQATPESGLKLERSRIVVTLNAQRFPVVSFDLHIAGFAPDRWQQTLGKQPFHFLTLGMPDAAVWHHRGWLNATPRADLFPLLLDAHVGTPELSAYPYNREWSTTPPLAAHPLPVIGLWAPERGLYAAWDFQAARLTDNSERDIATGYCNRLIVPADPNARQTPEEILPPFDVAALGGLPLSDAVKLPFEERSRLEADRVGAGKFVALVYPYGGVGYQQCVYPQAGAHLASRATLAYSLDLHPADDPNRFLWETWWADDALRTRLPQVPPVVDLSWIGEEGHLKTLPGAPGGSLLAGVEANFQVPGTQLINGWTWHNESAVAAPARRGDHARLAELEREAETLARYAKRFTVAKEPCVYWEKPLIGRWTDEWGGAPVTTLHNANGWAAGRLLLDLYRYDGKKSYLPLVEGVYNWTKHIVWTRNEFADVPSSPFAIGGSLAAAFLLDYYFAFKDDADRRTRALEALEMARSFTYRYMVMWTADNREDDNLDSAFLWEPNSGRDWTGAACSNEVIWNLDTLAQIAVHTGDPVLLWALQGSLSRWHLLYQDVWHDTLSAYRPADFTEGYGLAPGNVYGGPDLQPGKRAAYGFGGPLAMIEPVGETTVRVVAGERAAMAFNREGTHTTLADYRCTDDGDFAFTVRSDRPTIAITITFPGVDLSAKPVSLRRNAISRTTLKPGENLQRDPNALWSLIVTDVHPGDTVVVGDPDLKSADPLPCAPPLALKAGTAPKIALAPFQAIPLPADVTLDADWRQNGYAGLTGGLRRIDGIPFVLTAPQVQGARNDIRLKTPISAAQKVYLLYAPMLQQATAPAEGDASPAQQPRPTQINTKDKTRLEQTNLLPVTVGAKLEDTLPTPVLDDGARLKPDSANGALAWRAWPPVHTQRLLAAGYTVPQGRSVVAIDAAGASVVAATALLRLPGATETAERVEAALAASRQAYADLLATERGVAALRVIAARLPAGKIGLLPPTRSDSPVMEPLARSGFLNKMTPLTPEQLIDPAQFNARRVPIAVYVGGEEFTATVHTPADVSVALLRYVREGGTLVLLSGQPYPLYYGLGPHNERLNDPLPPRFGLPLVNAIEAMPTDVLTVEPIEATTAFGDALPSFHYPAGDPRLRAIDRNALPTGAAYTALYRVRGAFGKNYGDAAGLLQLPPTGDVAGGRILYISNVLLRDPVNGPRLIRSALQWLTTQAASLP
jgi:hypothetical protein